jgi:hypothetical protein
MVRRGEDDVFDADDGGPMTTVTTTETKTYQRCREEHRFRYLDQLVPVGAVSPALAFGTVVHAGLEAWWASAPRAENKLALAIEAAMGEGWRQSLDEYELVRAQVMLERYDRQWKHEAGAYEVLGVEERFVAERRGYTLAGKYDAVAMSEALPRRRLVIEHKTTSEDIGPGAAYWGRLAGDLQVSNYLLASLAHAVIYDVLRKPRLTPRKATAPDRVRYRKDGQPYASNRSEDESIEAWGARLNEAYDAEPGTWFARKEVVRLQGELVRAGEDMDRWGAEIAKAHELYRGGVLKRQPRSPDACMRFGRECEYRPLCYGETSVEDGQYQRIPSAHPELG